MSPDPIKSPDLIDLPIDSNGEYFRDRLVEHLKYGLVSAMILAGWLFSARDNSISFTSGKEGAYERALGLVFFALLANVVWNWMAYSYWSRCPKHVTVPAKLTVIMVCVTKTAAVIGLVYLAVRR